MNSLVLLSYATSERGTYSIYHPGEGNSFVSQPSGGCFTQNSVARRTKESGVSDHECLVGLAIFDHSYLVFINPPSGRQPGPNGR